MHASCTWNLEEPSPNTLQRLVSEHIAHDTTEATAWLTEIKKYLWLCAADEARIIPMFSTRLDEVWHAFVICTEEYAAFCAKLGRFIPHSPDASHMRKDSAAPLDRAAFESVYKAAFGPLPEAWSDELGLRADTRLVLNLRAGSPRVRPLPDQRSELVLDNNTLEPTVLLRVAAQGKPALEFISAHSQFCIRELPGLPELDRLRVCEPLVRCGVLKVVP